ncbi:MAG TPA: ATP-binding protein [Candidatus Limnocylindria bacterium]|nr:ATP-binding protein [Candidatus Limnocylindria bacterium]
MNRGLRSTRARLTLVSLGVLAAALLIAGAALVGSLAYAQRSDVDAGLTAQALAVASSIEDLNGTLALPTAEASGESAGGVTVESAIVGPDGVLTQTAAQPLAADTLIGLAATARTSGRAWADVTDTRGNARRAIADPLSGGPRAAVLVISRPVGELDATLRRTALLLAGVSLALLVTGGALSYWLAGRILRPVRTIAAVARSLGERDLHRRVTVPVPDDELGELVDTFNEMLARLEASFESLRRFTADASHELRAPLALMRTDLDVALTRDRTGPEYRETLGALRGEVVHLTRLADQLLVLARADAGSLRPRAEPVDVADLLHEAAARWRPAAVDRGVRLDVEAPDWGTVRAEPALIRRVLDNLIDNAIRYAPPETAVTLMATGEGGGWWIAVSDRGPGIAPEHRALLFRRFARPDSARTRERGGAGLGLALSAGVIAAHGGRIELVASHQPGARFRFFLPG